MKYGLDRSVRLYFSISDISQISGLDSETIVQWEEIFPLKPTRNRAGKRVYRQVDLHKVQWIQRRLSEVAETSEIIHELENYSPTELKAALEKEPELPESPQIEMDGLVDQSVDKAALVGEIKSVVSLLEQLKTK